MKKAVVFIIVFVSLVFVWAVWITSTAQSHKSQVKAIGKTGALFDLEKDTSDFEIKGFTFLKKYPPKVTKANKRLKTTNVWLLNNTMGKGSITLRGLQQKRRKLRDVALVIRYHVFWDGAAYLTAVGTDKKTHEQVSENLPQGGESYCVRWVFMGPVDEVTLEAVATQDNTFVIIDDLKVSVGSQIFDKMEDVMCL